MCHHLPSFVTFNARVLPVDTEGTPQNTCQQETYSYVAIIILIGNLQRINIEAKMLYLALII
ncbi:hypothetical protein H5410_042778 [Solanum commersonii]|uniref:Uncharacterized protein n=1 Tax=Solanum commersonii TaxID=4109 RepID=A0A9J5XYF7_SOLCO|nr:hypothetical protein H5410_042778 [Solanum commersonii]